MIFLLTLFGGYFVLSANGISKGWAFVIALIAGVIFEWLNVDPPIAEMPDVPM